MRPPPQAGSYSPWKRWCSALLLAALAASLSPSRGDVLWQLGQFDESSAEFSPIIDPRSGQRRIDYANPEQDPMFVIGSSDPAQHWFSFQPGSANGGAGFRPHPFALEFQLPETPRGRYRLTLALLAYSTRLPTLEIEINGRRARFYQQPKLAYSAGDPAVFFLPHYATSRIECELPVRFLKPGLNRLVFMAIDQTAERDDVRPSGFPWPGNSGIVYDALKLERDPEEAGQAPGSASGVLVLPTIFYTKKDGQLFERVDVIVQRGERPISGTLTLALPSANWKSERSLRMEGDFGETRLTFDVPEFAVNTSATVRVEADGKAEEFPIELNPKRKWELFIVPNEHLDIGYTDYDWKVAELQGRTVDAAISLARQNPDFRFTFDGYWIIEQFMKNRAAPPREAFLQLVRERKLFVPAVYGSSFTGFASLENLIRGLYPSKRFARENGAPFDCALVTDVPSYSWSFASVLAAAGVKYFVAASDAYRAPFLLYNRFHERSPQWWAGPDGARVLTWYSRHYHQVASLFGMPPQIAQGHESLPRFLQAYDHSDYRAHAALLYGTQVENVALHPAQASFVSEWNRIYAYPKLRYAGFTEALDEIVQPSGDHIPLQRGDGGPYWEDGLGANARITALARRNMYRVLAAETFSTLSAHMDSQIVPDRERLDRLWRNLLLTDEHTWHADQSVRAPESEQSLRQGAAKDARSLEAERLFDEHLGQSLAAIAQTADLPSGTVTLFNSLSWTRRGLVELDLPKGQTLVDAATGRALAHERLFAGNGFERVRFLSPELPAVGYHCLNLKSASAMTGSVVQSVTTKLENPFYRVELDPGSGSIRSIFDKTLNRDLVDAASPYRFNQHLYVTGADALPNRLVQYSTVAPMPALRIHKASGGAIKTVTRAPFGLVAKLESTNLNTPRIETEIILFDDLKRIEIINRFAKIQVYSKEAVYFAFPFAGQKPRFRYATPNGFVDPARDLLPGAGREWFCVQQWLAVEQQDLTIGLAPVDAPLVTIGDIARGAWPAEFGQRNGTIFSYAMNNYTPEGYQAGQGGEFVLRYVISSFERFDPVPLHRMGTEALTPVERNETTRNDNPFSSAASAARSPASFLEIDSPNVSLVTWKLGERGNDSILRFVEIAGRTNQVTVKMPKEWRVRAAMRCNAVEDDQEPLPFTSDHFQFAAAPFAIVTLRLTLETAGGRFD
ncbi:MAG: hypothetical protein L0Z50_13870 [Verrucomicrobiales bacterium]|nr:hypothetical protein [Verrucomicrobiales bacterium]